MRQHYQRYHDHHDNDVHGRRIGILNLRDNPSSSGPANTAVTGWTRTLAPLPNQSAIISLSTSGFTVLPWNYAAAVGAADDYQRRQRRRTSIPRSHRAV